VGRLIADRRRLTIDGQFADDMPATAVSGPPSSVGRRIAGDNR
jgi:hypothetical protein